MPNNRQRLIDRFLVVSDKCYVQPDIETALNPANINWRHKADITWEEVVVRRVRRDCKNRDIIKETLTSRGLRMTFNYTEVTPAIMAFWGALFLGASTAPTGTPADETQMLARTGTVSGGTFKLRMVFEGRTVTTAPIAWDATALDVQNAITHSRMLFIQPGDVVVEGDWDEGMQIIFMNTGRLAKANMPLFVVVDSTVTGGGSVGVSAGTNGAQYYHQFTRSASNDKQYFSFVLGWDSVTDRVEQYAGFVVEQFNPAANLDEDVQLSVVVVGPWEAFAILDDFVIPACQNIEPLVSEDVKVIIDGNWETVDINNHSWTMNDAVPTDKASANGFDSVDFTRLKRGDQPSYEATTGVFGDEESNVYDLARNERTQDPVGHVTHFGQPGNRFSIWADETKVKFGSNRLSYAGTLNESVINLVETPYKNGTNAPVRFEAYINQSQQLLQLEP